MFYATSRVMDKLPDVDGGSSLSGGGQAPGSEPTPPNWWFDDTIRPRFGTWCRTRSFACFAPDQETWLELRPTTDPDQWQVFEKRLRIVDGKTYEESEPKHTGKFHEAAWMLAKFERVWGNKKGGPAPSLGPSAKELGLHYIQTFLRINGVPSGLCGEISNMIAGHPIDHMKIDGQELAHSQEADSTPSSQQARRYDRTAVLDRYLGEINNQILSDKEFRKLMNMYQKCDEDMKEVLRYHEHKDSRNFMANLAHIGQLGTLRRLVPDVDFVFDEGFIWLARQDSAAGFASFLMMQGNAHRASFENGQTIVTYALEKHAPRLASLLLEYDPAFFLQEMIRQPELAHKFFRKEISNPNNEFIRVFEQVPNSVAKNVICGVMLKHSITELDRMGQYYLISHGMDIHALDQKTGTGYLRDVALTGDDEMCKWMVTADVPIATTSDKAFSVICEVMAKRRDDCAELLLDYGYPNDFSPEQIENLCLDSVSNRCPRALTTILANDHWKETAVRFLTQDMGKQALLEAIDNDDAHTVQILAHLGVPVNEEYGNETTTDPALAVFTPIIHAAAVAGEDVIRSLRKANCDVGKTNSRGMSALTMAGLKERPNIVRLLENATVDLPTPKTNATLPRQQVRVTGQTVG